MNWNSGKVIKIVWEGVRFDLDPNVVNLRKFGAHEWAYMTDAKRIADGVFGNMLWRDTDGFDINKPDAFKPWKIVKTVRYESATEFIKKLK